LEASGRFCADVLFPLNGVGDREGCAYEPSSRSVRTPAGFKDAWRRYCEAGWPGLAAHPDHGGQGLPALLQAAFNETQCSANQAWALYAALTLGAYECLRTHGLPEQQALYLPMLATGEWTG